MDSSLLLYGAGVGAGLLLLWKVSDLVVHYTVELAERFKISTFFLGFIILAMAANIPEISIAISSALNGVSEVSAGNVVGANFSDITLVIGLTLLLAGKAIVVNARDRYNLLIMLALTTISMIGVFATGYLTQLMGFCLMAIYALAITWLWRSGNAHDVLHEEVAAVKEDVDAHPDKVLTSTLGLILKLACSFGLVIVTSELIVFSTDKISTMLQLSHELIGATLLGIGTSLPELALSMSALRRGHFDLALGPTLGTVFAQTTLILGLLGVCSMRPVQLANLTTAALFMFAAFTVIGIGLLRNRPISRGTGAVLLSLFFAFLAQQFLF
jgi:cation:H+ antiporter